MDMVIERCFLTDDEVFRLRAAIIASSVEVMLMDRINQDDALKAAEQILPMIEAALRSYADETTGIGVFKRGEAAMIDDTETAIDLALETVLATIDRATIALHLSRNVSSARERLERANQARDGFAVALVELNEANAAIKSTEAWREWYEETQSSYQAASDRVVELPPTYRLVPSYEAPTIDVFLNASTPPGERRTCHRGPAAIFVRSRA
jgi:hypothetical protein